MSKIFPKSANALPLQIVIFLAILAGIATAATTYYATPKYTRIGYQPVQPVPFEHSLHAGQLGSEGDRGGRTVRRRGAASFLGKNGHQTGRDEEPAEFGEEAFARTGRAHGGYVHANPKTKRTRASKVKQIFPPGCRLLTY